MPAGSQLRYASLLSLTFEAYHGVRSDRRP
jgi:hypothetical protein